MQQSIPDWVQKWSAEWLHKMECQGVDPKVREGFKTEIHWLYEKISEDLSAPASPGMPPMQRAEFEKLVWRLWKEDGSPTLQLHSYLQGAIVMDRHYRNMAPASPVVKSGEAPEDIKEWAAHNADCIANCTYDLYNAAYQGAIEMYTMLADAAPASPVEEKQKDIPDDFYNEGLSVIMLGGYRDTFLHGITWAYRHLVGRKPPPVIEMGEQKEMPEWFLGWVDGAALENGNKIYQHKVPGAQTYSFNELVNAARYTAFDTYRKLMESPASHPAPAPIVGEREERKYPIGGYAPGNYHCNCVTCKQHFKGDKRAVQCEPCAIKAENSAPTEQALPEEAAKWIADEEKGFYVTPDTDDDMYQSHFSQGAIAMYHKMQEELGKISLEWFKEKEKAYKFECELEQAVNKLEAANEKIKEKQQWIDSHI